MEGFNNYVQEALSENSFKITDKIKVKYEENNCILVSLYSNHLVKPTQLEEKVNNILLNLAENINKEEKEKEFKKMSIHAHQLRNYENENYVVKNKTIGVYEKRETASELFPNIAQEYQLETIKEKAEEVAEEIKSLFNKRISDL